jgi:hypothetical protein
MAVLPGFPGLEVEIVVNKATCHEYSQHDDERNEDSPTSATKYIEAKDGANFLIRINLVPPFKYIRNNISAEVKVDGQIVQMPLWRPSDAPNPVTSIEGIEGETARGWRIRKLVFANLLTGMILS